MHLSSKPIFRIHAPMILPIYPVYCCMHACKLARWTSYEWTCLRHVWTIPRAPFHLDRTNKSHFHLINSVRASSAMSSHVTRAVTKHADYQGVFKDVNLSNHAGCVNPIRDEEDGGMDSSGLWMTHTSMYQRLERSRDCREWLARRI